jgi:hypothetical protein
VILNLSCGFCGATRQVEFVDWKDGAEPPPEFREAGIAWLFEHRVCANGTDAMVEATAQETADSPKIPIVSAVVSTLEVDG